MQRAPRVGFSAFPTEALLEFPAIREVGNTNRLEYIIAFSERKRVLTFIFCRRASFPKELQIISRADRKDALTNFFVLSNMRFVLGGSGEMLRTSRCFRITLFQSGGPRTLSVMAPSLCSISSSSEKHFAFWERLSPPIADRSKSLLKRYGIRDQFFLGRDQVAAGRPKT
jgi:hypothetical protein